MASKLGITFLLLALAACSTSGQGQGKGHGHGRGNGHGYGRNKHGGGPAVGGPLVAEGGPLPRGGPAVGGPLVAAGGPLPGGGGGQFRESGGFRQTQGKRVEEGFEQTDFYNQGRGNGAAFLGTNSGVLQSGLLQEVKGKFKIMGKVRGYTAASTLQQQHQG